MLGTSKPNKLRWLHAGVGLFLALGCLGGDWPGFRGPRGLGLGQGPEPPLRWSANDNILWKVKLPGPGASSPMVWKDQLFLTCYSGYGLAKDQGDLAKLRRHVLCLDRRTGQVRWQQEVAPKLPESPFKNFITEHGYASSTPVTDGERVYIFFGRTGVFAFDLAGRQLWHTEVGRLLSSWGSAASPLLFRDLLLICAGVESDSLVALDKQTGKEVWRLKEIRDTWTTPLLVDLPGGQQEVVLNLEEALMGIDPQTGEKLWHCEGVSAWPGSTPVAQKGIVFATGAGGEQGKVILAVRAGGRGDVGKTHVLWKQKIGAGVCSPLLVGNSLYLINGDVACLRADSGKVVFQERLYDSKMEYVSPVSVGNKIYAFTRRHGAYVLAAKDSFELLAHNDLGDKSIFNASPAVSQGQLFIRSNEYLYCIGDKR